MREFNGSSDSISLADGGMLFNPSTAGMTVAAILKSDDKTSEYRNILIVTDSGFAVGSWTLGLTTGHALDFAAGAVGGDNTATNYVTSAMGVVLVALTRAAGEVAGRFHRYRYDTNAWDHSASAAAAHNPNNTPAGTFQVDIGAFVPGPNEFWDGHLGVVGAWNRQLSDAEIELLPHDLQNWYSGGLRGLWVLDQATVGQAVPDLSGNGGNQSAISGTSVSAQPIPSFRYGTGVQ